MTYHHIKLNSGVDLLTEINTFSIRTKSSGFVGGVVGNLSCVTFKCPQNSSNSQHKGDLEIITLNGTFSPDSTHLHLSFSDSECKVWGGHLEKGTIVLKGLDLLLCVISSDFQLDTTPSNTKVLISPRLEIAVLDNCPWSARTIRTLKSNKIPFKIINIRDDSDFANIKDRSGYSTFPQLFVDNRFIGGFDEFSKLVRSGKLDTLM